MNFAFFYAITVKKVKMTEAKKLRNGYNVNLMHR